MSTDVTLPPLGESVNEATISRWMKNVGDSVTVDEPLLEVSTDKVDTEIPAPATGVLLAVRFNEDDVAQVGDVLGVIGEADQAGPATEPVPRQAAVRRTTVKDRVPTMKDRVTTEKDRATTEEAHGIAAPEHGMTEPETQSTGQTSSNLGAFDRLLASLAVPPSAPSPQFDMTPYLDDEETDEDEEGALDDDMEPTRVIVPPARAATPPAPAPEPALPPISVPALDDHHETYITPLVRKLAAELGVNLAQVHGSGVGGRIRKQDLLNLATRPLIKPGAVADTPDPRRGTSQPPSPARLARAELASAATLSLASSIEVDVTQLTTQPGGHIGAILQSVAAALRVVGELNASLLGDAVVYHNAENIGWVVDTTIGPLAPVIHDAGGLDPSKLEAAIAALMTKATAGSLSPTDLAGGTFTVRDDGASGLAWAMPAINRPQVAALSIGCVNHRADIAEDGTIVAVDTVFLTLAYDRRVADPGAAANFLQRVKAALSR